MSSDSCRGRGGYRSFTRLELIRIGGYGKAREISVSVGGMPGSGSNVVGDTSDVEWNMEIKLTAKDAYATYAEYDKHVVLEDVGTDEVRIAGWIVKKAELVKAVNSL